MPHSSDPYRKANLNSIPEQVWLRYWPLRAVATVRFKTSTGDGWIVPWPVRRFHGWALRSGKVWNAIWSSGEQIFFQSGPAMEDIAKLGYAQISQRGGYNLRFEALVAGKEVGVDYTTPAAGIFYRADPTPDALEIEADDFFEQVVRLHSSATARAWDLERLAK